MTEVEQRLQEFCRGLDVSQGPVDLDDALTKRLGESPVRPLVDRTPTRLRPWPVWATVTLAFAAVLLMGGTVWILGLGGGSTPSADTGTVASGTSPLTEASAHAGGLLDAVWSLESSYDGWLVPVAFEGGYAAISHRGTLEAYLDLNDVNTDVNTGDVWVSANTGDVWVSADGIRWEPALVQPPEPVWNLSSDGDTLFAETGNPVAGTVTIWASRDGSDWRPVLEPGDYTRLSLIPQEGYPWPEGTVAAGSPGAVVFGADDEGAVAAWFYDGDRFVPADAGSLAALPADSTRVNVVALEDRFLLYTYGKTGPLEVSLSTAGEVWSDSELRPADSPLAWAEARISGAAWRNGLSLVAMTSGYGLWATDGSSWEEVFLRPSNNDWTPEVAAGELGWIVYSPPFKETFGVGADDPRNLGLWFSPDAESWTDLDEIGPMENYDKTIVVRDDHVLVFSNRAHGGGAFGVVEGPFTEVWRLDIADGASDGSTITVSFDEVEGLKGLLVIGRLYPDDPDGERPSLGATHYFYSRYWRDFVENEFVVGFAPIDRSPYSGSDLIRPMDEAGTVGSGIATFRPGTYRLVIEAYESPGQERYGCEMPIRVTRGEPLLVNITDLPAFPDEGLRWAPDDEGRYPVCPGA